MMGGGLSGPITTFFHYFPVHIAVYLIQNIAQLPPRHLKRDTTSTFSNASTIIWLNQKDTKLPLKNKYD